MGVETAIIASALASTVMGVANRPKAPPPPPEPVAPPAQQEAKDPIEMKKRKKDSLARGAPMSTLLTGEQGAATGELGRNTLLGG